MNTNTDTNKGGTVHMMSYPERVAKRLAWEEKRRQQVEEEELAKANASQN
jgi:hypothetical protein